MPPTRPASATSRARTAEEERTFSGDMGKFAKLSSVPLLLAAFCAAMAIHAATTIPARGDQTLREISIWVPGFWAVVLPLCVAVLFLYFRGQSITISRKAFVYRRGHFTCILNWYDSLYSSPQGKRFDRQATLAGKSSTVVIRSLFFPQFDEIAAIVERYSSARDSGEYTI